MAGLDPAIHGSPLALPHNLSGQRCRLRPVDVRIKCGHDDQGVRILPHSSISSAQPDKPWCEPGRGGGLEAMTR